LAADLKEAEAEGASAEEVLGSGAFDPRSFAASWAAERGVAHPAPSRERVSKRSFMLVAIAAFVAITLSGAGLVVSAPPSNSVVAPVIRAPRPPSTVTPAGLGHRRSHGRLVLLIVGPAGIIVTTLVWLWLGRSRWAPRNTYIDDHSTGPAY